MVHEQIEELRLQMQKIASDKDLTDPRVVRVSERLARFLFRSVYHEYPKSET